MYYNFINFLEIGPSLETVLIRLNKDSSLISSSIPELFYFSGGVTGERIEDWEATFFMTGNVIIFCNDQLTYSDNLITSLYEQTTD
jgi:hypothetical protein